MRLEFSYISDLEKEFSKFTKYIRFYFKIQYDNHNEYVLYINKKTLKPEKVQRNIYGKEEVYCPRCNREHNDFCPFLNNEEVLEELMHEFRFQYEDEKVLI